MTNLVEAYQRNNITEFEKVLKLNRCAAAAQSGLPTALNWHVRQGRTSQNVNPGRKGYVCAAAEKEERESYEL